MSYAQFISIVICYVQFLSDWQITRILFVNEFAEVGDGLVWVPGTWVHSFIRSSQIKLACHLSWP